MFKNIIAALALCLGFVASAQATTITTETWYLGGFGSTIGSPVIGAGPAAGASNPGAPDWTLTVADDHMLRVFDCCALGDVFEIFDFNGSLGLTAVGTSTCNSTTVCASGTGLSRGDFLLGAGSHSISMTFEGGLGDGNLFFIVEDVPDRVPEPATLLLAVIALGVMGLSRRRVTRV